MKKGKPWKLVALLLLTAAMCMASVGCESDEPPYNFKSPTLPLIPNYGVKTWVHNDSLHNISANYEAIDLNGAVGGQSTQTILPGHTGVFSFAPPSNWGALTYTSSPTPGTTTSGILLPTTIRVQVADTTDARSKGPLFQTQISSNIFKPDGTFGPSIWSLPSATDAQVERINSPRRFDFDFRHEF
jgi:hypothetical protein